MNASPHTAQHAPESPSRVDTEEDVVKDHKCEERPGLADSPWLLAVGLVVDVEALDSDSIEDSDGQGNLGVESRSEPLLRDVEGAHNRSWYIERRNGSRRISGREAEKARIGHGAQQLEVLSHDGGINDLS